MRLRNAKTSMLVILFTGLSSLTQIVTGQTSDSVLTLKACIRLSVINNFKLKQAQLETAKSLYRYKGGISPGLPQVQGFGAMENYFDIPVTMVSGDIFGQPGTMLPVQLSTKYNANAGIQVGQMIYSASYFASLKLFKKSCEISDLNLQKGQEELAYHVSQLYVYIQISDLQLALLDSNLNTFQIVHEYTKQHYTNGFISKMELDRVTVAISNLEAEKENLLSAQNQQLNMLKYLIGIEQSQPVILSEYTETWNISLILEDSAFCNHTDIKILEQTKELAMLNLKLTRSECLPSLTGYAAYSYQAQREQFDLFDNNDYWYKTSFVGIRLNIPIFEGGRVKNKINQNKIELEQIKLGLNDLKNELYVNYLNALQKLNTSKTVALKMNGNMTLAGNIIQSTNDQYRQGLKSLTDVLNAQSEYNTSRLIWLQTVLQIRLSELEIAKMNGTIRSLFL